MILPRNKKIEMERKIIGKCFGTLDVDGLNAIVHNCAKLIIKDSYKKIVSGDFEMPNRSDIEQMISKELGWNFNEDKVFADIKHNYHTWSDEMVYDEVDKLEDIYEDERSIKIESIIKATVKESQNLVEELRKEVKA